MKIMLISPKFFNLEKYIEDSLVDKGHEVYFYDERMSNTKINKILTRKFKFLVSKRIKKYYSKLLEEIDRNSIDCIIVIKAENMPEEFISNVKNKHPNIKLIHYMYDPIKNYPHIYEKTKLFDKCYTFDNNDAEQFGWIHRPLFYPKHAESDYSASIKYSGCFIGTLHSDRAKVLNKILKAIPQEETDRFFVYYYIPLISMFLLGKYIKGNYSSLKIKDVSKKPLPNSRTYQVMLASDYIVDMHHDNQSGLTMRTIETLGLKKRIITTNQNIKDYDFYDENNIMIVDKDNPVIDETWFKKEYKDISEDIYNYYSVDGFTETLLESIKEE